MIAPISNCYDVYYVEYSGNGTLLYEEYLYTSCGGSGGGGTTTTTTSTSVFNVDCGSFTYLKTTTANWQESGLNKIRLRWSWIGSGSSISREIYINHIVFGLPQVYGNGTTLTPGQAATLSAQLLDDVKKLVYTEFKNPPYYPTDEQVISYFRTKMHAAMVTRGGTAGMTGSGSSAIVFNDEERTNFSNPYDCK